MICYSCERLFLNDICKFHVAFVEELPDDPYPKRRRTSRILSNGDHKHIDSENLNLQDEEVLYGAELVIYDKHRRCQLTDGDYELALQDLDIPDPAKAQATWETVLDGKVTTILCVMICICCIPQGSLHILCYLYLLVCQFFILLRAIPFSSMWEGRPPL